tara:strand:- start:4310 stop:5848 length:1539 start_codon:yes stop_codon:yes gene_type:complete
MNSVEHEKKYLTGDHLLKGEYYIESAKREQTLTRSERYAGWTIPTVFPDDPLTGDDEFQNDFQSVGAQAVNNLSNKIMMALFQPSRPFFRLTLTPEQEQEVLAENIGMNSTMIEEALAEGERGSMRELEKINARVTMTDCIQQLIITGNSLLYMPEDNTMQSYSIRDYVIERDLRGNMVKIIIRETKSITSLSDEMATMAMEAGMTMTGEATIYTAIQKVGKDQFVVWQELEDLCYCHVSVGRYKQDELPWIPLTWTLSRNKDYGTGLVEMYSGDFHTLSTLAEAILDYTTIMTDVKVLVDPTGMTNVRTINEARSGDYVHGREEDLYVHSANVQAGADFLTNQFMTVERRIAAAFLLNNSVTRDAERVTAEEIRMQAQELESSYGGVYSRLATDLQLPLAKRLITKFDPVLKDIEPVIVTGLESLSRNSELDRTRAFFSDLVQLADVPEQVAMRIDYNKLITMLGAGHGIDYKDLLKDEKQVQADQQAAAAQQAQAAGMEAGAVNQATGQE